jgi:hypothetical protein
MIKCIVHREIAGTIKTLKDPLISHDSKSFGDHTRPL